MTTPNTMDRLIPLTYAGMGQRVRVSRVDGGQGLRSRLCAMGLMPGVPVEVIANGGGPVLLKVLGARMMIGRGMAAQIMVAEA
jgi:Fe2+ transport system protein FeoA